jgi:hypothetical protein
MRDRPLWGSQDETTAPRRCGPGSPHAAAAGLWHAFCLVWECDERGLVAETFGKETIYVCVTANVPYPPWQDP